MSKSQPFSDFAPKFFEHGYSVVPAVGKACRIPNWPQYREKIPPLETMESWIQTKAGLNVAMPMGPFNGLCCIDIDFGELFEFEENRELIKEWSEKILRILPPTPLVRKGRKPFAAFFRYRDQVGGAFSINGIKVGEFITHGLITIPPSIHPETGESYKWANGVGLTTYDKDDLLEIIPEFTEVDFAKFKAELETFLLPSAIPYSPDPIELGGIPKGGRNNRLKDIAWAMYSRPDVTVADVARELFKEDMKHDQPLFSDKREFPAASTPKHAAEMMAKSIQRSFERRMGRQVPALITQPPASAPVLELVSPSFVPGLQKSDKGVRTTVSNVVQIIEQKMGIDYEFWFDEFFQRIYLKDGERVREWADYDDIQLTVDIQRNTPLAQVGLQTVQHAVELYARTHKRNAPRDWMEGLEWDGVERISDMLWKGFGALPSDYVNRASRNFMISMVARVFRPGCKVDNMLVLEGGQGKFKSSALGVLGGDWFMESVETIGTIDFLQSLHGKMLVEIAELDSFSKADARTVKKTVTCQVDRYRPSYGRHAADYPRTCVFVGTTNEDEYLEDATGGRRFWPIRVVEGDLAYFRSEREQLFAEAVFRFKAGETWWEMPVQAEEEQAKRRRKDAWEDPVIKWILKQDVEQTASFSMDDIAYEALEIEADRFGRSEQMRLGNVLKSLGCERVHTRYGKRWKLIKRDHLETAKIRSSRRALDFSPKT